MLFDLTSRLGRPRSDLRGRSLTCEEVNVYDATRKSDHGRVRLAELTELVRGYIASKPFAIVVNRDETLSRYSVMITVNPGPPDTFGLLLGDVLHNFRSALDCVVAEMARAVKADDSRTQFPICDDPADFDARYRNSRLRGLRQDQIAFLEGYQPYAQDLRFIHPLSYLRDMSNVDKHRLILPIVVAADRVPVGTWWNMNSAADLRISYGPFIPNEPCVLAHVPFSVAATADAVVIEPDLSVEIPGAMHRDLLNRLDTIAGVVRTVVDHATKLA